MLKTRFKIAVMSVGLIAAGIAAVHSQGGSLGFWSNWPILGNPGFCSETINGNCSQQVGPGTATVTGNELIPLDTELPGGQMPQSERVFLGTIAQHGQGAFRNALIGGDFFLNLWQRGTTPQSAATPSTSAMSADRWAVYSSANTVTITKDTTAGDLSPSTGINAAMKITRPSGTNTTAICVGQILPQEDSARFLAASNGSTGAQAIFSFYANPLSGFLSTNDNIIATIAVYTATDSATPGTNTDAFMKGTIAGYTVINPTSATVTTAPSFSLGTGWARYSVTGVVPAIVSTNAVTGIGVTICTPVYPASTGVAGDGFLIANAQLETGVAANTTTGQVAQTTPGGFSRRLPSDEAFEQLTFSQIIKEPAASISVGPSGQGASTTTCVLSIPASVAMREAPTATYSSVTTSTWTVTHVVTNTALVSSGLATTTGGNLPNLFNITATVASGLTAGQTCTLTGATGGATITESSEP